MAWSSRLGRPPGAVALNAAVAALLASAIAWLGPPGVDAAAHVYQRALFLQHGFQLWNNYWYAGRYSFVSYSLLYYPLAAVVGIKLLAVATASVAAAAFAAIAGRDWPSAGVWPARSFSLVAAASVLTGAFPYALGLACALVALWAIGSRRLWLFAIAVALAFAASPLAFVLLLIMLVSIVVAGRMPVPPSALAAVITVAAAGLVVWRLFPEGGTFPFPVSELLSVLLFCALGVAFTKGVRSARTLTAFFIVYGAAAVVCFLVPSAIGGNIARLRFVAMPVALLALSLRRWRPIVPTAGMMVFAAAWNLSPLALGAVRSDSDPSASATYWAPVVQFLRPRLTPSYRVEVVDTADHWEAAYLPEQKIPIVRGWFRQDDFPQNALLSGPLVGSRYVHWLRSLGVAYVVLTDAPVDYSAVREAELLRHGVPALVSVFSTAHVRIYAVRHPTGIVTGAPGAHVVRLLPAGLTANLPRAGRYRIATRYSPYWAASFGCVTRTADGMAQLTVRHGGTVQLVIHVTAVGSLRTFLGLQADCR